MRNDPFWGLFFENMAWVGERALRGIIVLVVAGVS